MGIVTDYNGLLIARVFLGVAGTIILIQQNHANGMKKPASTRE